MRTSKNGLPLLWIRVNYLDMSWRNIAPWPINQICVYSTRLKFFACLVRD